ARVSGLIFQTYPGARKTSRQLQTSSGLIFDVFREFDPENLLLEQARREVMERQFEESRLARTLRRLSASRLGLVEPRRVTPLGFPLVVERMGVRFRQVSHETFQERVEKMRRGLEADIQVRRSERSRAASKSK